MMAARESPEMTTDLTDLAADAPWPDQSRPIALRSFCARILGGSPGSALVDDALRILRLAAARRFPLVLQGEGDLTTVAHVLHRELLGPDARFVLCDLRLGDRAASGMRPTNRRNGHDALVLATNGTVCARGLITNEANELVALMKESHVQARLFFCVDSYSHNDVFARHVRLVIPSLRSRRGDVGGVIMAYAQDALELLDIKEPCLTDVHLSWIFTHAKTLSDISKSTLRLSAIQSSPSIALAAQRLGLSTTGLYTWLRCAQGRPGALFPPGRLSPRHRPRNPEPVLARLSMPEAADEPRTTEVTDEPPWPPGCDPVALHAFCSRLLGWSPERMRVVEHAVYGLRLAAACKQPLVLCGEGNLGAIAFALHRRIYGAKANFIVCNLSRGNTPASGRLAMNRKDPTEAFARAEGGTVCAEKSTRALASALCAQWAHSRALLVFCVNPRVSCSTPFEHVRIIIPPLTERKPELRRLVGEYAVDALDAFDAPPHCFTEEDRVWVMQHAAHSIPEIERTTLRIVALRALPTMTAAARRLGMSTTNMTEWRSRLPGGGRPARPDRSQHDEAAPLPSGAVRRE